MTDQSRTSQAPAPARRRPSLYRTVVGIAIAALLAAWLPFSVMYVTALDKRVAVAAVTWKSGHAVLTTKTSGGQTVTTSAPAAAAKRIQTPVSVTTRSS